MTGIDPDHMNAVLPQVVETIKAYANLDPAKDMVPVKPTAHYTMGGIPITTDGEVYRWAEIREPGRRRRFRYPHGRGGLVRRGRMLVRVGAWGEPSGRQLAARRMPVRHARR